MIQSISILQCPLITPNPQVNERSKKMTELTELERLEKNVAQLRGAASALEEYISSSSSIEMLFTEDGDCPLTKLRIALGARQ